MSTVVHKLRIRSAERDAQAVAARMAAQLNAADLSPAALPPGATLVVRRLGSGLPPWRIDNRSIRPPADWQAAVSQCLDGLLRRAVRARRGEIPDDAEAILFLDDAEMLSAIAIHWIGGELYSHWCWHSLFSPGDPVDTMLRVWMDKPEAVPGAIARLVEARRAGTFVQRLPEPVLENLARGIIRVFALRHLEPVFKAVFKGSNPPPEPPAIALQPIVAEPAIKATVDEPLPDEATPPPMLAPKLEAIASPFVRQAFFLELAVELERTPFLVRTRDWAVQFQARLLPTARPVPVRAVAPPAPEIAVKTDTPAAPGESRVVAPVPFSAEVQPPVIEPASSVEGAASDTTCIVQAPRAPRRAEPAPPADRFEGIEIHTGFGGIFYLINLAIYLGYYGDFSTPEEPGIDLPIWDFLAQTGRELAGQPLPEDPVWPLLTSLGEGEPWDRLEDAMRRIRDWLDEALGHHEGQREDTGAFVLRHSARVVLTGTRLDVFLSLQELPIEIRIARLDRDAGWVPAAGRYIAFHFL